MSLLLIALLACGSAPQAPTTTTTTTPAPTPAAAPEADGALLQGLKQRHETEGQTPEGTIGLWLTCALMAGDEDAARHEAGMDCIQYLTLEYKDDDGWAQRPTAGTFLSRVRDKPWIFRSYAKGTTPETAYATDTEHISVEVTRTQEDGDRGLKVFIVSNGADSPRPVYMKRSTKTGLYYVANHANLYVDVRPPVDPEAETFE